MNRKFLLATLAFIILVGALCMVFLAQKGKARKELAAYKAELRAKGEFLTYEDAGYPFPLETNACLEEFVSLAGDLASISTRPGYLDYTALAVTGRLSLMWQQERPSVTGGSGVTWKELRADCKSASTTLAALRSELENPPRRFDWNYTNPFAQSPRPPFVAQRQVAQFLSCDALVALHEGDLATVQADLHALTQLAQVYRDDYSLVNAMIRVAISGLALDVTKQALSANGWEEESLKRLQADWEGVDLPQAIQTGVVGDRMMVMCAFEMVRSQGHQTGLGVRSGFVGTMYRSVMDSDELFYIQQLQGCIEAVRRLQTPLDARSVLEELKSLQDSRDVQLRSLFGRYKHLVSAVAIPNTTRAVETTLRSETERRMTITAIALNRNHLRTGQHPGALVELVPRFLSAEFTDPWSGKPLGYRLNGDGSFTLYSVGEDGHDDGGDPAPSGTNVGGSGMWKGKDVVWPVPVRVGSGVGE